MIKLVCIALGGAVGALARYAVGGRVQEWSGSVFPWGTLAVNLSGCLAIGLLAGLFDARLASPHARALVVIGFLGAYTTFSTFGLESVQMLRGGAYGLLAANVLASNVGGLALVMAGFFLARAVCGVAK